ncbi:MAG: hypothetical protein KME17_01030 [Cyanosarcina radialis HA8281-LM2]|jgi:hypothetical protein|nr:hypothetical protein [Cyanosarcina radialis HA8281-LM2]
MSIQAQQIAFLSETELSDRELEIVVGGVVNKPVPLPLPPKPCPTFPQPGGPCYPFPPKPCPAGSDCPIPTPMPL